MNYSNTSIAMQLSSARLSPYLRDADGDLEAALELYKWSTRMSMAMLELISHLEVMMRNSIDMMLSRHYGEDENGIPWFLRNPPTTADMSLEIDAVRNRLRILNKDTRHQVIAGMNFGFWTGLIGVKYEELWRSALRNAFPGSSGNRKDVMKELEALRKLRNRLAHHDSMLDIDVPFEIRRMHRVAGFFGSDAVNWLESIDRTSSVYNERPVSLIDTVIVSTDRAWHLYQYTHAYICKPGRGFRDVQRMAFYSERAVQPDVPKIYYRRDNVPWTKQEIDRLRRSTLKEDRKIAQVIEKCHEAGWANSGAYQVFLLSRQGAHEHRQLPAPVPNQKMGLGSAFVNKQRYVSLHKLETAKTTADLLPVLDKREEIVAD